MTRERPRGLFARLRHLVKGMFTIWLRDTERQNPAAVYEQAISERTKQYRELKEAVAGILYMRNKLEAEINERRVEIARLHDDIRSAIRRGQDDLSLALISNAVPLRRPMTTVTAPSVAAQAGSPANSMSVIGPRPKRKSDAAPRTTSVGHGIFASASHWARIMAASRASMSSSDTSPLITPRSFGSMRSS